MNLKDITELSLDLREKLINLFENFYSTNKNITIREGFEINSIALASVIAQLTYQVFKKNLTNLEIMNLYIDQLCESSKIQLKNSMELIENSQ